jgi:replicative DNA helicase
VKARRDSVGTDFPSLDTVLGGGLRKGDLILLGGEVGSGKSALALAIALRASEEHYDVTYLSAETAPDRVRERAVAMEARASIDDLRRGVLEADAETAVAGVEARLLERAPSFRALPPGGGAAIDDWLRVNPGTELLVVDPLQGLCAGRMPLEEEVAAEIRALKNAAIRYDVALLATTALTFARDRHDRRPQLDDFGTLAPVKQFPDVILGLYREEMHATAGGVEGATELHILKNRNGPTGYVDLYFYKKWLRFEDVLEPDR